MTGILPPRVEKMDRLRKNQRQQRLFSHYRLILLRLVTPPYLEQHWVGAPRRTSTLFHLWSLRVQKLKQPLFRIITSAALSLERFHHAWQLMTTTQISRVP